MSGYLATNWHPSDAYDWNRPDYDPTGDPYYDDGNRYYADAFT